MQLIANLKVGQKIYLVLALVSLVAIGIGVFGLSSIKSTNDSLQTVYEDRVVPLKQLKAVSDMYAVNIVDTCHKIRNGSLTWAEGIKNINEADEVVKKQWGDYVATKMDAKEEKLAKEAETLMKTANISVDKARDLMQKQDKEGLANYTINELYPNIDPISGKISDLVDLQLAVAKQKYDDAQKNYHSLRILFISVLAGGIGLVLIIAFFIIKRITGPINALIEAADKLAVGDVNVNVEITTKDEVGILMQSFAKMVANIREQALAVEKIAAGDLTEQVKVKSANDLLGKKLSEMIETNNQILTNINTAAEQVASGARQVAASGQALSHGSAEQASSVEEITASMTQVATQTKQNAVNANQANELATVARDDAAEGNVQMQEMVKAMSEINESSANIFKIIKVIDEIAFQTNILALNAAVEAARAGQHGKGFAVVAEEVRNLAARSANAAKETTTMIEGSIKKVEAGTKIANETAEALNDIVAGVTKAAALVGDIAAASNEQATAIAQVNQAIAQVSQVTQTNSATAEESASASEELSSQAEVMKENVRKFKLKQISQSFNNMETLSPEVLRAIENMMDKKRVTYREESGEQERVRPSNKSAIVLDDNEFGKY